MAHRENIEQISYKYLEVSKQNIKYSTLSTNCSNASILEIYLT